MPTASNRFRLKLQPNTPYNFSINWGDGSREIYKKTTPSTEAEAGLEHVYTSGGLKTVSITENVVGGFPKPYFNAVTNVDVSNDAKKITKITQWGTGQYSNLDFAFTGCTNLQITATDGNTSKINQIRSLRDTFRQCLSLSSFPSNFNTSNVTNFTNTWLNCANINNFPLINMNKMFTGVNCFYGMKLPTLIYDQLLVQLSQNNLNRSVTFYAGLKTNYSLSALQYRNVLTQERSWNITDGGPLLPVRLIKQGGTTNKQDQFAFFVNVKNGALSSLICGSGCYDKTEFLDAGPNVNLVLDYNVTSTPTCSTPNVFYTTSKPVQYTYNSTTNTGISMVGNGVLNTGDLIVLGENSGLTIGGTPLNGTPYQAGEGVKILYKDITWVMGEDLIPDGIEIIATISCD
jgi:hypothetical protein